MDKTFGAKTIKDLGLLDTLEGEERLYMQGEEGDLEEVTIPLEYFTESEFISNAVVNLLRKYAKDSFIASKPVKVTGFKVEKDSNGKNYLSFVCLEQCEERNPEEVEKPVPS